MGVPYEGFRLHPQGTYWVMPIPEKENREWWDKSRNLRYVVLSLGINNLALHHNVSAISIMERVYMVIEKLLRETDVPRQNFIYIIPYPKYIPW
jgi:hypothetical protein